jgi:hypothetical protein
LKELIKEGLVREYKTKRNIVIYVASGFVPDLEVTGGNLFRDGKLD